MLDDAPRPAAGRRLHGQLIGADGRVILQEVLEGGPVVPDRGVQAGDGLGGVLEPGHPLGGQVERIGQLVVAGLATGGGGW
jgi:hypothetical protein